MPNMWHSSVSKELSSFTLKDFQKHVVWVLENITMMDDPCRDGIFYLQISRGETTGLVVLLSKRVAIFSSVLSFACVMW